MWYLALGNLVSSLNWKQKKRSVAFHYCINWQHPASILRVMKQGVGEKSRTCYQGTNYLFRSFHEIARYTKICIWYNILIPEKLWYPTALLSWRCCHRFCCTVCFEIFHKINAVIESSTLHKNFILSSLSTTKEGRTLYPLDESCVYVVEIKWDFLILRR